MSRRPEMFRRLHALPVLCALVCWALFSAQPSGQAGGAGSQNTETTILGSVVDASLTPLAGVAVTLERDGRVVAKASTGADGTYRLAGIAAGTYRIKAELAGFPMFERELRVPAGPEAIRMPIVMARPADKLETATADLSSANARTQTNTAALPPAARPTAPPPQAQAGSAIGAAGGRGGGSGFSQSGLPVLA